MKIRIVATLLLVLLSGCATCPPAVEKPAPLRVRLGEFENEFNLTLANLLENSWGGSGDWRGDLQGDATVFAAMLLFELGNVLDRPDLSAMAKQTVDHEARLVRRAVPSMEMVVGFPALAAGCDHGHDSEYARLLKLGCRGGYQLAACCPGMLDGFVRDRVTLLGSVAHTCLRAGRILDDPALTEKGLSLIDTAEKFRDVNAGLYRCTAVQDWPQAVMIMALTEAYRATLTDDYLLRAEAVMTAANNALLDNENGGYYGHPDLKTKGLSGNNNFVWALLDLYELTGRRQYLEQAHRTLAWLFSPAIFYDGILMHHWSIDQGRAAYACTGCNFAALYNIWRFNRLLER